MIPFTLYDIPVSLAHLRHKRECKSDVNLEEHKNDENQGEHKNDANNKNIVGYKILVRTTFWFK